MSINEQDYNKYFYSRIINIAISSSAMRNQGDSGLVASIREYIIQTIDLDNFAESLKDNSYHQYLNAHSESLEKIIADKNASWGTARKALNMLFKEVVYSKYFSDKFKLDLRYKSNHKLN